MYYCIGMGGGGSWEGEGGEDGGREGSCQKVGDLVEGREGGREEGREGGREGGGNMDALSKPDGGMQSEHKTWCVPLGGECTPG